MVEIGRKGLTSWGRAAGDLRRHNRAVVLELIRTKGPVSRADLVRETKLSMATIIEIVAELTHGGLVSEVGTGFSTGGRRPILLELVPRARSAVGLEVGTQTLTAVLTDLNASVKLEVTMPSEMASGPEAVAAQVRNALAEVVGGRSEEMGEILGVGVALPAPILSSREGVFNPPSFPDWGELRLGELISKEYGFPVLIDNDANAAALGEHLFGAGRETQDMFYVIVHRGVGGAAIVNGELYRGTEGGAGELGHTLVDPNGPLCGCGAYGCLEAFVGRASIARRAREAMEQNPTATVLDTKEARTEDIIRAALEGDDVAQGIVEKTGWYLGIGISNIVNLFDPEIVVLGGSTMSAGDLLLNPAKQYVRHRALDKLREQAPIVAGDLGESAGSVGAAALILRELFIDSMPEKSKVQERDRTQLTTSK